MYAVGLWRRRRPLLGAHATVAAMRRRLVGAAADARKEVEAVNRERKLAQTAAAASLNEGEERWLAAVAKNREIQAACEALEVRASAIQDGLPQRCGPEPRVCRVLVAWDGAAAFAGLLVMRWARTPALSWMACRSLFSCVVARVHILLQWCEARVWAKRPHRRNRGSLLQPCACLIWQPLSKELQQVVGWVRWQTNQCRTSKFGVRLPGGIQCAGHMRQPMAKQCFCL